MASACSPGWTATVLAEPDVGTVVIDEGLQDLLSSAPTVGSLETAYDNLIEELNATRSTSSSRR